MTGLLAQLSKTLGLTVTSFRARCPAGLALRDAARRWHRDPHVLRLDRIADAFRDPVPEDRRHARGTRARDELEGRSVVDRGAWRAMLSQPTHEVVQEEGLRVPMRDGTELRRRRLPPRRRGEVPRDPDPHALQPQERGAGQRSSLRETRIRRLRARRARSLRERPANSGHSTRRRPTAPDTTRLARRAEWCDGQIGMIGGSYGGVVQWFAAKSGNAHLKAIIPGKVSPPDPNENFPYEGGVFMLAVAWRAMVLTTMDSNGGAGLPQGVDWERLLATLSAAEGRRRARSAARLFRRVAGSPADRHRVLERG